MAIRLLERGITSFTIYEKSGGVGGTWRDNSYPGAACDVPSHLYSFSFAPKTDWTRKFAEQPEILSYFESLVDRFDLGPHLRFHTAVTAATWDDDQALWHLKAQSAHELVADSPARTGNPATRTTWARAATGEVAEFDAEIVVSGLGQLNRPNIPDIPGLESFEGTMFHSARWDHDHDLRGERVAVVGIGASAIQFVPQVAQEARQLTLFQRSVNYVAPKPDRAFRSWEHWLLEHVPPLQRLYRESIYWRFEARFMLMRRGSRMGAMLQKKFADQLAPMVQPGLPREALIPEYTPGCRRILIANDWYPTLLRPNTSVVTDSIERVTPKGLVTSTGAEIDVDTIIFGTGFHATEFLSPLHIHGRDGVDLNEVWKEGARALLGVAVAGFPNLFILYGPNTNLGHNSILFMIEQQVGYILQLIDDLMAPGVRSVEVTDEAMARFDDEILAATAKTVWAEDCASWYKNDAGRVTNNWPDFTVRYRRRMRHPDRADFATERTDSRSA